MRHNIREVAFWHGPPSRDCRMLRPGLFDIVDAQASDSLYLHSTTLESQVDVIEAIHERRSIRSYATTPVERDIIESLILDAAQAPPPFSGEVPWTFNVVQGVERIAALGTKAMSYAKARHRPNEPGWGWLEWPNFKIFWDAPVLIIISGCVEDCCRAGQNLMLSAHARGLGTCWVGSPMLWLNTDEAKAKLSIPPDRAPVSALCLGYPKTVPEASKKSPPPIIWLN